MNSLRKKMSTLILMMNLSIAVPQPRDPFAFVTRYVFPFVDRVADRLDRLTRYHPIHLLPLPLRKQVDRYYPLFLLTLSIPHLLDLVKDIRKRFYTKRLNLPQLNEDKS